MTLPSPVLQRMEYLHVVTGKFVGKVGANPAPVPLWIDTIDQADVAIRDAGYVVSRPNNPDLVARIDAYLASIPAARTLYEGHPDILLAEARDALCQPIVEPAKEAAE